MMQNTARLILCLLAAHVLIVNGNNTTSHNECETKEFARCNQVFEDAFKNADKNENVIDTYCTAYKELGQCLTSNAECVGEIIDLLRSMVHQHMILDKKLGICPTTDLAPLRKLVQDNAKYRMKIAGLKDLDADSFQPCSARKNLECVSRYAEDLKGSAEDSCTAFTRFFKCYTESTTPVCDDQIYKDYVANVNTAGRKLLEFARDNLADSPC